MMHVCTHKTCPMPGKYFVTASDDGGKRFWLMAGPYLSHRAALDHVNDALNISHKHDPRAWFMSWGTVRMPDEYLEIGKLQRVGLMERM